MPFVWSTSEQTAHQWKAKSPTPRLTGVSQVNRNEFVLTYSWKSDCKSSPITFSHFSKTLATQKSRHAITHIKTQPIRPLSDSWILVFSKLLQLQATWSTLRGTRSSLSMGISSWCCSLFTFLHLCAPEIPGIRPAASPQVPFPFSTAVFCQVCCIILVFSLWFYCIRNPGMEEEAGWQTQVPFAATPTEAEEGAVPGWGVAFPQGRV